MAFGIVVAAPPLPLPCNLDYCQWQQLYLKLANKLASLAGAKNPGDARLQPPFTYSLSRGRVNLFFLSICLWLCGAAFNLEILSLT